MAIYEDSRYTNTEIMDRDTHEVFDIRRRPDFNLEDSTTHEVVEGDTIDYLAYEYYGSSHLNWVILEANKQYDSELEIKCGDELIIPDSEEVADMYD